MTRKRNRLLDVKISPEEEKEASEYLERLWTGTLTPKEQAEFDRLRAEYRKRRKEDEKRGVITIE